LRTRCHNRNTRPAGATDSRDRRTWAIQGEGEHVDWLGRQSGGNGRRRQRHQGRRYRKFHSRRHRGVQGRTRPRRFLGLLVRSVQAADSHPRKGGEELSRQGSAREGRHRCQPGTRPAASDPVPADRLRFQGRAAARRLLGRAARKPIARIRRSSGERNRRRRDQRSARRSRKRRRK